MPHDELFFECSVEPLDMGIHFWRVWVNEVVGYLFVCTVGMEVLEELRSIVGLHAGYLNIDVLHDNEQPHAQRDAASKTLVLILPATRASWYLSTFFISFLKVH